MIECGYILLDNNINEEPDVLNFLRRFLKRKKYF